MKVKKLTASTRNPKASKVKTRFEKHSERRDRMLKDATERADSIVNLYERLNPDLDPDFLLGELFYDLMHLCDISPQWQSFEQAYRAALAYKCDYLEAETEWLQAEMAMLNSQGRAERC